nr:MAG TPA: protein of unknown function (DUF2828) [Caudoviricetes sp.]
MTTSSRFNAILDQDVLNITHGENGDPSYKSTHNPLLDLYGAMGALRGRKDEFLRYFEKAYEYNPEQAIALLFKLRDIRHGLGERELFRAGLRWLEERLDTKELSKLFNEVIYYGRYDDLWKSFKYRNTLDAVANFIYDHRLDENCDIALYRSIGKKWLPRNPRNADERYFVARLRSVFGMNPKAWRQYLNEPGKTLETKMCSKEWSEINYNFVPSQAMSKFNRAFKRNDEERYAKWLDNVYNNTVVNKDNDEVKTDAKVNAGTLYPYQVLSPDACEYSVSIEESKLANSQWNSLPDLFKGRTTRILPMIDVSGSMHCSLGRTSYTCLDASVSLGVYCAQRNKGAFHNIYMTFSSKPILAKLEEGKLLEQHYRQVLAPCHSFECMNTDIDKALDRLLQEARRMEVPNDEMPETLLILSDMNFDDNSVTYTDTFIERVKDVYKHFGYTLPKIVFWNLNHNGSFACTAKNSNVIQVSGFSPNILEDIFANIHELNPVKIMEQGLVSYLQTVKSLSLDYTATIDKSDWKTIYDYKRKPKRHAHEAQRSPINQFIPDRI